MDAKRFGQLESCFINPSHNTHEAQLIHICSKTVGQTLKAAYSKRMLFDLTHIVFEEYQLLPSNRRYRVAKVRINRLNCFSVPQSVQMLEKSQHWNFKTSKLHFVQIYLVILTQCRQKTMIEEIQHEKTRLSLCAAPSNQRRRSLATIASEPEGRHVRRAEVSRLRHPLP